MNREAEKMRATGEAEEVNAGDGVQEMTTSGGSTEKNSCRGVEEQQLMDPADHADPPECPICNEAFHPQRTAALLDCGHMLCSHCLAAMARPKEMLSCPFCRRTTKLRLDHQAVAIHMAEPEQRVQYSLLLHKLLGCCVYAPPWTFRGLQVILMLLLLGCLLYVLVPVLAIAFS